MQAIDYWYGLVFVADNFNLPGEIISFLCKSPGPASCPVPRPSFKLWTLNTRAPTNPAHAKTSSSSRCPQCRRTFHSAQGRWRRGYIVRSIASHSPSRAPCAVPYALAVEFTSLRPPARTTQIQSMSPIPPLRVQ
ncbi:hypothetical protein C8Q73DRAFT_700076 [Cubamyces lactineus]|nr:hypothetical protein C8Q73DRAFT_700076 [Cubamyces lactineus]